MKRIFPLLLLVCLSISVSAWGSQKKASMFRKLGTASFRWHRAPTMVSEDVEACAKTFRLAGGGSKYYVTPFGADPLDLPDRQKQFIAIDSNQQTALIEEATLYLAGELRTRVNAEVVEKYHSRMKHGATGIWYPIWVKVDLWDSGGEMDQRERKEDMRVGEAWSVRWDELGRVLWKDLAPDIESYLRRHLVSKTEPLRESFCPEEGRSTFDRVSAGNLLNAQTCAGVQSVDVRIPSTGDIKRDIAEREVYLEEVGMQYDVVVTVIGDCVR